MTRSARIDRGAGLPLLALLLLGAGAASAADLPKKAPGGDPLFMDTVNVSVINVDVYVTDKKTNTPVTGLTRDDFEILEDNKPMSITNFFAVNGGKPIGLPEPPPPPAPAAGDKTPPPLPDRSTRDDHSLIPEDQRLWLIVYIDNYNIHPFNRNRVMRELRVFLNTKLHRGDEVMLVSYDRSLHVRRSFTSDPDLITSSLVELEKFSGDAVSQDSSRKDALRNIDQAQSPTEALNYAHSYAEEVFNDLSFSIDALKDTVNALAGVPGRKAVLYVSDGLPMSAGQEAFFAVQEKYQTQTTTLSDSTQFDASRRFTELANQANANRVSFYTISAAGLQVYSSISAENQGNGSAGSSTFIDSIQMQNMASPMQFLAEKTGGIAVVNANIVMPYLDRIARDFDTFYSLGYSPPHYGDGRYHKVTVKLKKKGYELRHREGYRDKSAEAQMSDGTLAALRFPFEENPLAIQLDIGTATQRSDGYWLVQVNVKIPLGKIVMVPRDKTHEGRVRLFIAAIDTEGGTSEVQQTPVPISVPNADFPSISGKHYTYTISLLMRGGDQTVAVGVRNDVAAQTSFVSTGVRVGGGR
ncbi:MAG TPA: VWA domain-containing protein [Thermoanaerobaculia bacterium]